MSNRAWAARNQHLYSTSGSLEKASQAELGLMCVWVHPSERRGIAHMCQAIYLALVFTACFHIPGGNPLASDDEVGSRGGSEQ